MSRSHLPTRCAIGRGVAALLLCNALIVVPACGSGDDGDATNSTATSNASATSATAGPTTASPATPTTGGLVISEPVPLAGTLGSATIAVRAACREFYNYDPDNFDELATPGELIARCDEPEVQWRSDCYAERPPAFVPGDGGCAVLGGYLAVWHGQRRAADRVFEVGADAWTVVPESD